MNMSNYLEFMKIFSWTKSKSPDIELLPMSSLKQKLELYEKMGCKTKEDTERLMEQRGKAMVGYIETAMPQAQFFEIDKIQKRLLMLSDRPKDKRILREVRLPYPAVFLDIELDDTELPLEVIREDPDSKAEVKSINGILVMEVKTVEESPDLIKFSTKFDDKEKIIGRMFYMAYCVRHSKNGLPYASIYDLMIPIDDDPSIKFDKYGKHQLNFFKTFLINFCLFITHPDVKTINITRPQNNIQRRLRQGKRPLPDSNKIIITGKLKKWVNKYRTHLEGHKLDHSVWVRGTYRHYEAQRYVNMRGKIRWIEPFIKGEGKLKMNTYELKADKQARKKYNKETLYYDDIKPLDEPLRDKKNKGEV